MRMTATENDIAELERARDEIQAHQVVLMAARAEREQIAAQCRMREASQQIAIGELNPGDPKTIAALAVDRAELAVLQSWVEAAPKVQPAIQMLRGSLIAAVRPIQAIAEFRSAEEAVVVQFFWRANLDRSGSVDDIARNLINIASSVLGDIQMVLAARRPIPLTDEERRTGKLLDENHSVIRMLTPDERRTGFTQT